MVPGRRGRRSARSLPLNGKSSAGTWKVIVSDHAASNTGALIDWELLTTPPVTGTCNTCPPQTDAPIVSAGTAFGLSAPRPNPFGERTELRFQTVRAGNVEIVVFDVSGRRVRTLIDRRCRRCAHDRLGRARRRERSGGGRNLLRAALERRGSDIERVNLVR